MDAVERAEEKMATNEVPANAELKKKDCVRDLPMKPESRNMLGSSALYVSAGSNWPDRSPHPCTDLLGGYSSNRCVTSSVETESPSTNPYSMNDAGLVVEELTLSNYQNPNLASTSHLNIREGIRSTQSQWQHLFQLTGGHSNRNAYDKFGSNEKDTMLLSAREDLRRMHFAIKDLKSSSKQKNLFPREISVHLTDDYGKIIPSNMIPLGGNRSKILSTSSFSQLFIKKALKGKGVISRRIEDPTESNIAAGGQNNEKQVSVTTIASNAILNSSAKNDNSSQHNIDGISLREWLKLGCHEINKVERLLLFRKIVQLVDSAHSQGIVLLDLRPSYFILLPSSRVNYVGSSRLVHQRECSDMYQNINRKRPLEQELHTYSNLGVKLQKLGMHMRPLGHQTEFTSRRGIIREAVNNIDTNASDQQDLGYTDHGSQNISSYQSTCAPSQKLSNFTYVQVEEKWYASPEELSGMGCTFSSNIYVLGVFLFELLGSFDSERARVAAMSDLRHRILPSNFLSQNSKEAGFCLWLLHPEPSLRPTAREVLQSEFVSGIQESFGDDLSSSINQDDTESELLLHFLSTLKEKKQTDTLKLVEEIKCLESDIEEIERRHTKKSSFLPCLSEAALHSRGSKFLYSKDSIFEVHSNLTPGINNELSLMKNIDQLESAYFSMRSNIQLSDNDAVTRENMELLKERDNGCQAQKDKEKNKPIDRIGAFFSGLCKYARYSKFEVRGILRNGDFHNSANVICSLSFDRDQEYFAAAGVSKKIKIYEFQELFNEAVDIHYPVIEMLNKSKLSCICWNSYIKNYLASTDYDGIVKLWDVGTGQAFSQYAEHNKRAWSVDFSQVDPTKLASGSDDCSVKLWNINERNSLCTIRNIANVCCVQFSARSTHLLAFGSADYKTYCYDLRNVSSPWCILASHEKAVSNVKFLDFETLVSASTDNTLKLWDLNKTNSTGLSTNACILTLKGHTNEKNFVGLSVADGYIACGSETNEVYAYYKSLDMPITSHKFGSIDPISGKETDDDNGQFVSSVCWKQNSDMLVAANSSGCIKVLQMV
ncbi:protein SPA1-RELATED 2-like [Camellia sinensis]|uniref:protein SPA1-RELATED 2-like n=1 Tax=Camellia sinensis TaxID=4442 RepID=UPI001036715A|nr:protein SPA1-RELATED 2-like [Camellia sinensis]